MRNTTLPPTSRNAICGSLAGRMGLRLGRLAAVGVTTLSLGLGSIGVADGASPVSAVTRAQVSTESADEQDVVDMIMAREPGATRARIRATIAKIARQASTSRVVAARALLDNLEADARSVAAEAAEAMDIRRRILEGDDGSVGSDHGQWVDRIHVSFARHTGDIVVAPNVSKHFLRHGHAAIYTTTKTIAQARGGDAVVEEVRYDSKAADAFAPGVQVMAVYTDEGKGPLLSDAKRGRAAKWARSRIGDRYRGVTSPNTVVVTGRPGSDGSKQNCSQLVWAAYKVANDYDFNPAPKWLLAVHPAAYVVDRKFVWPKELVDAPQTKVYAQYYVDPVTGERP